MEVLAGLYQVYLRAGSQQTQVGRLPGEGAAEQGPKYSVCCFPGGSEGLEGEVPGQAIQNVERAAWESALWYADRLALPCGVHSSETHFLQGVRLDKVPKKLPVEEAETKPCCVRLPLEQVQKLCLARLAFCCVLGIQPRALNH